MTTEKAIEYAEKEISRLELLFDKPTSSYGDYALYGEHLEFFRDALEALKNQSGETPTTENEEKPEKPVRTLHEYTVSIAVDGRVDVTVEAGSFGEAKQRAFDAFADADLSQMDVIGFSPVNAERDDGEFEDF